MQRARNDNKKSGRPATFPSRFTWVLYGDTSLILCRACELYRNLIVQLSVCVCVFMEWMLRGSHLFIRAPDTFYIFHCCDKSPLVALQ